MKPVESRDLFDDRSFITESSGGTSNPKSQETFSIFGDGGCGEPLCAQHVTIDFTPNSDVDNDFVQKKVCSFWHFIENTPEIQNLKVRSEVNRFAEASITPTELSVSTRSESKHSRMNDVQNTRTAVDMLEILDEKHIHSMFASKLPPSHCTLGSREYVEKEIPMKKSKSKDDIKYSTDSRLASRKLKKWDSKHPKSMQQPSHAPALQHCVFQKQVRP